MNRPIASLNQYEKHCADKALSDIKIRSDRASTAWKESDDVLLHVQLDMIESKIRELREILFL